MPENYDFDAAVVHANRVCEINLLRLTSSQLHRLASAMQDQFPALIHLKLDIARHSRRPVRALPGGFLGGSGPRLQSLELHSIPFPALPKLLLSTTDIVHLKLWHIPHSGYFSPEAIVTGLAVLANLKSLTIEFESPLSRPNRESRHPPPQTRTVLPSLTRFEFKGVDEYLEDLVARIDAPSLDFILITFFHQLIFDILQLGQFMRRTTRFQALNEAYVDFGYSGVQVKCLPPTPNFGRKSVLRISCKELDWQLSSLAQIFTSFIPSIYMLEHLYIDGRRYPPSRWQYDIENMQWLEILQPFSAVKNLYVYREFTQCIASALQEVVEESATDVLPTLGRLFLEQLRQSGDVQKIIGNFAAARRLLGHPVAVSLWDRT